MKAITMKTFLPAKLVLTLVGILALGGFASIVQAQPIYSDTLIGTIGPDNPGTTPDPLDSTPPDTQNTPGQYWDADAGWQRTELGAGYYYANLTAGDAAYLPFALPASPIAGTTYTLQATLVGNQQVDYAGNVEFGFTSAATHGLNYEGFANNRVATVYLSSSSTDSASFYTGIGSSTPVGSATFPNRAYQPNTLTVDVILTATGSGWTASYSGYDNYTNETVFSSGPYALTDPADIQDVGFVNTAGSTIIKDFSLTEGTEAVPEPSTWALFISGGLILFVMRLRRKSGV